MEILKPRPHHRAVVDELRQKTRRPYFRKPPKSETRKRKFACEESVRLNLQPDVVGIFVGKQGRNLREITDKVDCQVTVQRDATVTVKAGSLMDVEAVKRLLEQRAASVTRRRQQTARTVGI